MSKDTITCALAKPYIYATATIANDPFKCKWSPCVVKSGESFGAKIGPWFSKWTEAVEWAENYAKAENAKLGYKESLLYYRELEFK